VIARAPSSHAALLILVLFPIQASFGQHLPGGFDEYVTDAMNDWQVPGLAVAVVKDDSIVLAKGYGVRQIGKPEAVNEHTLFAIGSNTKAFTVTALGMLVQEGRLSWDDPVTKHLKGFQLYDPYVTREITVRDLLCHRSGYPRWGGDLVAYGSVYSREDLIYRIRFLKPSSSFRSKYGYCNWMFLVAGEIIPPVVGASWDDFVKQRIFDPLGMGRTNTSVEALEGLSNVARPHTIYDGGVTCITYRNDDNIGPAGSIISCVGDMAKWTRMQLAEGAFAGEQLLDVSIIRETRTPHTIIRIEPDSPRFRATKLFAAYGLGWFLQDYRGRLLMSHGGGIDGMLSMVAIIPEEKLGLVILTNYDQHSLHAALCYHILDAFLGETAEDWSALFKERFEQEQAQERVKKQKIESARVTGTRPSRELHDYSGTYENTLYGQARVEQDDGKLVLHLMAHPDSPGDLDHWHYDTFCCRWRDRYFGQSFVPFELDEMGRVRAFGVKVREDWIDPLEYRFERVFDAPAEKE
jgi:CubicO group peptidase (beta-lactamase class C family)